ncbi:MAG: hypothetical protein IJU46_08525 [Clostridia bacterium]|nr:hypothetical protein [Clostridia bacterium]
MKKDSGRIFAISWLFIIAALVVVLIITAVSLSRSEPGHVPADTSDGTASDTAAAPAGTTAPPAPSVDQTTEEITTVPETTAEETTPETTAQATTAEETTLPPPPEPVFPMGIFVHKAKSRVFTRADTYKSYWPVNDSDIAAGHWRRDWWTYQSQGIVNLICDTTYFFVIPSNEEQLTFSTSYGTSAWAREYDGMRKAAGLEDYKIGYQLDIITKTGDVVSFTVTRPDQTFLHEDYFELYLYDEIHRPDAVHITQPEMTPEIFMTDIKITLRNRCYEIDHIDLTAFYYKSQDEFDAAGFYTGVEKKTIRVEAENR